MQVAPTYVHELSLTPLHGLGNNVAHLPPITQRHLRLPSRWQRVAPVANHIRGSPITALSVQSDGHPLIEDKNFVAPALHSPRTEASASSPPSPRPPPFSSLYFPSDAELDRIKASATGAACDSLLATAPAPSFEEALADDEAESRTAAEIKAALPPDTKGESSSKSADDGEPPPPYTEGSSPLDSFTYIMAATAGAASIITQVQQAGPPVNTLGGLWESSWFADVMQN